MTDDRRQRTEDGRRMAESETRFCPPSSVLRRQSFEAGFSLLELTVTTVVLMIGLLGLMAAVRTHSRQMEKAESWCQGSRTYYVVSQTNTWMRQLGAPADLNAEAGQAAWAPPVSGTEQYRVSLDSRVIDAQTESASVQVQLTQVGSR
jgi:Tfp pilus assembly protein PilV